jgi:glycosyltransferase involved in cell wall biosynthesis
MPGWRLVVVGDGPTRAELTRLGASVGIDSRLTMAGSVDDAALGAWLGNADVFVSMSEHEAFGIAVLEAAIAGIPVVASDIPAHRELAEAADGAISLVPPDISPDGLASAVRDAAGQHIPTEAASALAQRFSWTTMANATVGQYLAVTSRSA